MLSHQMLCFFLQALPPHISQLGLIDTLHYVGYAVTDIGSALDSLQACFSKHLYQAP